MLYLVSCLDWTRVEMYLTFVMAGIYIANSLVRRGKDILIYIHAILYTTFEICIKFCVLHHLKDCKMCYKCGYIIASFLPLFLLPIWFFCVFVIFTTELVCGTTFIAAAFFLLKKLCANTSTISCSLITK